MKQVWEIKKLVDVVDFQRGLTYSKKDEVDFSNNIVLRSNNVNLKTNSLDFNDLRYISDKIEIPDSKKVTKGSLIVCTANGSKSHLGKVALIDNDYGYAFGGFMGLLKPKETLNSNFLFYAVTSNAYKKFIGALSDGANINNLKFSDLGNFEIALPPLPEQQRIVSILDEAFSNISKARDNAEQSLKNVKELFESYLQSVFTNKGDEWSEDKLCSVCDLKSGTTISPSLERESGDVLYTKVSDMTLPENLIEINTSNRFVNSNEIKINQIIPKGSIIFPKRGGAIATNKKRKIVKPTIVDLNTMAIIPSKKIDKDFLFYWFSLIDLNDISNGTSIPQINNYSFDEIYISYPISLKEQSVIVKKFEELSAETKRLETIYQQKLNDLEELKKSVLQKAFNGEL